MVRYFIYNDAPVKVTGTASEIEAFLSNNEHLADARVTKTQFDAKFKEAQQAQARDNRRQAYRNGDYIDALIKQMNYDRMNGRELVQDMDDAIGHWSGVKDKFPIPE